MFPLEYRLNGLFAKLPLGLKAPNNELCPADDAALAWFEAVADAVP